MIVLPTRRLKRPVAQVLSHAFPVLPVVPCFTHQRVAAADAKRHVVTSAEGNFYLSAALEFPFAEGSRMGESRCAVGRDSGHEAVSLVLMMASASSHPAERGSTPTWVLGVDGGPTEERGDPDCGALRCIAPQ
jgi:hypothetical protein